MEELKAKYPWFDIFYNWLVALLILALFVSFVIWGLDIRTERRAAEMTATARAAWESELQAEADAEAAEIARVRESQEYVMEQEATELAKAFYGIRNFVEKYHYSEADLATYARCIFNRVYRADTTDLAKVVGTTGQFLGYDKNNPVLEEYYELALRLVREWHNESTKPCDVSYQFAELTPDGVFLKQNLHADGYERRWRA